MKAEDFENIELNGGERVEVFHYSKEIFRSHSSPFNFVVLKERFEETRKRLLIKSGINKKEFERIKIIVLQGGLGKPYCPTDGIKVIT